MRRSITSATSRRILSARAGGTLKKIKLDKGVAVETKHRDYGYLRAHQYSTPFPQKSKPIDLDAVRAKLEAEKNEMSCKSIHSVGAASVKFSREYTNTDTERGKAFALRRKVFDEGEFTVCKGRKITDSFHPTGDEPREDQERTLRSREARYFEELTNYCLAHNIEISKGAHQ